MSGHLIETRLFEVHCEDGTPLSGSVFIPSKPKAVIHFNCGTAIRKEFYRSFGKYLASAGYVFCLWDYRGIGENRHSSLRNSHIRYTDYGTQDIPAVYRYLKAQFPELPYILMGHSTGGQQPGFSDILEGIHCAVNFAVSSGYHGHMPLKYRLRVRFFFRIFAPLSLRLSRYVKARTFGFMEDLPAGVLYPWRDWCHKPDYFFDPELTHKPDISRFTQFSYPIHTYWASDDPISNALNLEHYWKHIRSTQPITFEKLDPAELKVKEIGHFGFFRKQLSDTFWPQLLAHLDAQIHATTPQD